MEGDINPPRVSEEGGSQKKVPIVLYLRRPIKISIFCMLFVPIFNVVSTAPGDILDTIECFSVVRNTLLSLATPNREVLMFFTQFHLVNDSKNIYLRLRWAKIIVFLVLCLSTGRS